ncbi:T9SS type A sorting domain-containing protein [Flammeovirga sp. EKP202]|uniref:VPS10 domain-containing protein n=1 Tax=Flammeovirga sp. EKP202 TaxID=2770592 RepID=UPI00165F86D8|nr:T9SS type A sorting domain-containing protein [Flammeovirga sp. EKP202]MBD0403540.1 T9SS type A sorting domain-containing protein [Flammeovirga sp. EKP202]
MTKKLLFATFLMALFCPIIYFSFNTSQKPVLPKTHTSEDVIAYEHALKKWKRKNGYKKSNQPKKYLEILNKMKYRTSGENYTSGYKVKELKKAIQKSNLRKNNTTSYTWIERGPSNSPGRTRAAVVDPNDASGNTILLGAVGGGIWKTTDKGASWTDISGVTSSSIAISCMAVAPSNAQIWYAGTGEGFSGFGSIVGNGVLKSTDGGATWAFLPALEGKLQYETIYKLIVDPNDANTVLIAASTRDNISSSFYGIYKTTDGGDNWSLVYNASYFVESLVFEPGNFDTMYATVNQTEFIKSTDGGDNWTTLSATDVIQDGRVELAVSPKDPNVIFASIAGQGDSSQDGNLYISRDKGDTWNFVTLDNQSYNFLGGQGWYDHTVLAHPFDENVVYIGGVDLCKVTVNDQNNGAFIELTDAYGQYNGDGPNDANTFHPDQHFLTLGSIDENAETFSIIVTNDGGIYHTQDVSSPGEGEGSWTKIGNGVNTTQIYAIDKFPNENRYFFGTQDNGSWVSPKNEASTASTAYHAVIGGDGFASLVYKKDPDILIGSYYNNNFEVSVDGGTTFTNIDVASRGLSDTGDENAPFITMLGNHPNAPDTLYTVGFNGIWKSPDFGQSWTGVNITENWNVTSFLDVEVSEKSPIVIWAGGAMNDDNRIYVSKDGGRSFNATSNFDFINQNPGYISGLATSPNDSATAYVTFSYLASTKIIKTTDFGETWTDITGFEVASNTRTSDTGFPDVAVFDVLEFPGDANKLWAATEIGLFETTDGGGSWNRLAGNFPAVSVWDLKIYDDQVIAGTHGRGAWTHDLSNGDGDGNGSGDGDGNGGGDGDGDNNSGDGNADTVTSIIDIPSMIDVSILKSPMTSGEKVTLKINNEINTSLDIEIINVKGQIVYNKSIEKLELGNYNYPVQHPSLGHGTYILKLSYNNQARSLKFIVQ